MAYRIGFTPSPDWKHFWASNDPRARRPGRVSMSGWRTAQKPGRLVHGDEKLIASIREYLVEENFWRLQKATRRREEYMKGR